MNEFLTLEVFMLLLTSYVSSLDPTFLIHKAEKDNGSSEEVEEGDSGNKPHPHPHHKKEEDDDDYFRGVVIAVAVIIGLVSLLIFLCCLCRCFIRRRQNAENSKVSRTVLAVVPRPKHLQFIANESYTGPMYNPRNYGSASAPYDFAAHHSYQNTAYDGYTDSGHFEAPPPYFQHPHEPEDSKDSISVGTSEKFQTSK